MQKIENIIFDLGGVILDIDYNLTRTAFEKLGVTRFDEMYSQATADKLFQRLETGHISEGDFFTELNKCTGLQLSPLEITAAWNAMLLNYRENSLTFLETIQSKYNLYLLSNTNFIHLTALEKMFNSRKRSTPFNGYFKKAFYSCEIGLRKPDADCYQWVMDHLSINPATSLFIDDLQNNVEAAQSVGLQTIQLKAGNKIEDLGL
ncbi:MAG TPA: HAD family phosphatase [Hanamia sp.]